MLEQLKKIMYELSGKMHQIRLEYKVKLEESINKELFDLEMKNARFNVNIKFS
jgi:DNA repair ATPase RecN